MNALEKCARNWGWWNENDPPIVSGLPKHPIVLEVINRVRSEERAKWEKTNE